MRTEVDTLASESVPDAIDGDRLWLDRSSRSYSACKAENSQIEGRSALPVFSVSIVTMRRSTHVAVAYGLFVSSLPLQTCGTLDQGRLHSFELDDGRDCLDERTWVDQELW